MTNKINWYDFANDFNKTKKTIGDFIKICLKYNISIEGLSEQIENDIEFIWEINDIGTLYQCKDCLRMEFVEIGKSKTHH